jgi:hypothetical protein
MSVPKRASDQMRDRKRPHISAFRAAKYVPSVTVEWGIDDVRQLCPGWSDEDARDFLERHAEEIAASALQGGWLRIVQLLRVFDQEAPK